MVLLLVRVSANEVQHANGLIFDIDAGTFLKFTNDLRIELLAGALEVVHRTAFGAPAGYRQQSHGCSRGFLSWLTLFHQEGLLFLLSEVPGNSRTNYPATDHYHVGCLSHD